MSSIKDDILDSFRRGDMLTRLILINIAVFVLYLLISIIGRLFQVDLAYHFIQWTALPSNLLKFVTRPWTLISYMFLHQGFMHILFNLLILFFTGRIFMEYMGNRKMLSIYLMGGIAGGLLYILFYNIFPAFTDVLETSNNRGASAAVMAVMIAAATYAPRLPVKLFFVLNIEFRWVALLILLMDLINLGEGNNMGGHLAHLGGAAVGYIAVQQMRKGNDITEGFSGIIDSIANWFKPKPKIHKVYSKGSKKKGQGSRKNTSVYSSAEQKASQARMDEILDKISRSGYESLSKEEKEYLFKIGRNQ